MSLYLSLSRPFGRAPSASSPRSTCFGIPLLDILMTCPNHLNLLLLSVENRDGILACCRTSLLVTLSYHLIFIILRRQRGWKLFSFFSCFVYVVHVSDPYRS